MLTPQQVAAKWLRNAQAAGPAITAAVQAMTDADNPCTKAGAKQAEWLQGVQRAAQANRFRDGCNAVTMAAWKAAMINKGVPNYQNGLADGRGKFERFLNSFLPHIAQGRAALPARGTLADNVRRATQMIQHLATFRFVGGQPQIQQMGGAAP